MRSLRRGLRSRASLALTRWRGTPEPTWARLPSPDRILVCRPNKRLGNILLLTPLLRSLNATFPQAQIDVLVRRPEHIALLKSLPGIQEVHATAGGLLRLLRLIANLRKRGYDLAVDPCVQSTNNRVAMALCAARYRLGFAGADQWLRLTHAVARAHDEPHQARIPLKLLDHDQGRTLGDSGAQILHAPGIYPDARHLRQADALLYKTLGEAAPEGATTAVVGFFTEATGPKKLDGQWWHEWVAALCKSNPAITLLQITPPDAVATFDPSIPSVGSPDLLVLAALLSRLHFFVAADSGPMHLAWAAGVPVAGLFAATDALRYGPYGGASVSFSSPLEPGTVAESINNIINRL